MARMSLPQVSIVESVSWNILLYSQILVKCEEQSKSANLLT